MLVQLFRSFGKALICEPGRTFKSVFSIRFSKQLWYCISVTRHVLIIYSYSLLHKTVNGRPSLLRNSRWDVWKSLYGGRKLHFSQQQIFAVSETVKEASGQSMTWPSMKWTILSSDLTARVRREGSEIQPEFTLAYVQLGLGLRCYAPTAGRLCSLLLTRAQLCLRTFPYHYSRIVCNFSSSEIKHEHHPWHEGAANDEWSATDASPARKLQKGEVCQMQKKKKRAWHLLFLFDVVDLPLIKGRHLTEGGGEFLIFL